MKEKVVDFAKKCGGFLDRHKKLFLTIFFVLIAVRLWLILTMNWYIEMESFFDSRLEVNTAMDMVSMRWAGDYGNATLCKGLAYPLFLAFSFIMSIPYPVLLFGLIVLASFLFARCLKPIVKNPWARRAIFLFLLYSPVGLGGATSYPYRNALAPWLVLIVLSSMLAIYLRRKEGIKKLVFWTVGGAFFAGMFWNLREDSLWFLPFMLLGSVIILVTYLIEERKKKKDSSKKWTQKIAFLGLALSPLIGILIWNTVISSINASVYGVYTTEDRTKTYEAKVLGQLISIDDGADLENDYWVSAEANELAKKASPTFAGLDLSPFDAWPRGGDFSIWALRDSVTNSGYYKDAVSTNQLYEKIYNELKAGFQDGTLKRKNGIQLSDTSGMYSINEIFKPIGIAMKSFINHVTFDEYKVVDENVQNAKSEADYILYENALGIRLLRDEDNLVKMGADRSTIVSNNNLRRMLKVNKVASNVILKIYNVISWVMFVFAVVGLALIIFRMIKTKKCGEFNLEIIIFIIGLVLTILLNAYLVGLWGTGFPLDADSDLYKSYTTVETVFMSSIEILGIICLVRGFNWSSKGVKRKTK